jgi:hypothetical protein
MSETPVPIMCANHPQVKTTLRCNRCEKPICIKCAVLTPTGYRCKECVRGQQKIFDTAIPQDYIIGGATSCILAFIGSYIIPFMGFFTIFLSPIVGVIIAEAARFLVHRRRSPRLFKTIAAMTAIGCIPLILFALVLIPLGSDFFTLIWRGVYAFVVTSTVYYRISGIKIA